MAGVHATIKRLGTEQRNMMKVENRVADLFAEPLDGDIFQWHFTIKGPSSAADGTAGPYAKGIYHGALIFSHSYPFAPPDIVFFTPNGRFQLDMKICSTISSYHKELWQPTYDINFILLALRLFMGQDDEVGVGAIHRSIFSPQEKERMAEKSWSFQCPGCGQKIEDIYNTHMAPYPETSEEKKSQVPTTLPTPSPSTEQTTGGKAQQTPLSAPDSSSMSPVVTVPESATSPTIPEVTPQGSSTSNSDAQQASSAEVATPQGDSRVVAEVAGSPDVDLNAGSPTEAIPRSTDHVQQNVGEVVVEEVAPQPLAVAANAPNVPADVPANEPPEVQVQVARWTLRFSMDRIDVVFKCCTTVLALILLRRVASWLLVKGGAWLLHIGLDYFIR